ncbi:MAG: DUF4115 domain-containing protein, partial [Alphaproteobacteria bacterium]|nr:DUF4115 domain-containing protein [Alphaproteobacteria bacterium]
TVTSGSGEGEQAAKTPAATVKANAGVSIGDMPASANLAAADTSTSPVAPDAMVSTAKPAVEVRAAPVLIKDAAQAQPMAPQDVLPQSAAAQSAASLHEGGDVKAAPVQSSVQPPVQPSAPPSVQAANDPPPPPAAPSAPARTLPEGASEGAADGTVAQQASQAPLASRAAASGALSYPPQVYGASNSNSRVELRARAESWVQVQGANNELLLTRMLRAGDSYRAPNRDDLVLMTGNAGAIEIIVDGQVLGALGPVGQVRRNVQLNAEFLRAQLVPKTDDTVGSSP